MTTALPSTIPTANSRLKRLFANAPQAIAATAHALSKARREESTTVLLLSYKISFCCKAQALQINSARPLPILKACTASVKTKSARIGTRSSSCSCSVVNVEDSAGDLHRAGLVQAIFLEFLFLRHRDLRSWPYRHIYLGTPRAAHFTRCDQTRVFQKSCNAQPGFEFTNASADVYESGCCID